MNRRTLRKYATIYLKQGILALLLFIFVVCLSFASSWRHTLFPTKVSNIKKLTEETFIENHPTVQMNCGTLYYTGYSNKNDKSTTGRYYYTITSDCLLYVLLDEQESDNRDIIEDYSGTFRLIEDANLHHALTEMMASELSWSSGSLKELSLPIVASQPDYHLSTAILFAVGLAVCAVIFLAAFLINIHHYYHCRLQARIRRPDAEH